MFKNLKRQITEEVGPVPELRKSTSVSLTPNSSPKEQRSVEVHHSVEKSVVKPVEWRLESLQKSYDEYRSKTSDLLSKKDAHINRLQDRVNAVEEKMSQKDERTHSIPVERDLLKGKLANLEKAYEEERAGWEKKFKQLETDLGKAKSDSNAFLDDTKAKLESEVSKLRTQLKDVVEENRSLYEAIEDKNAINSRVLEEAEEAKCLYLNAMSEIDNLKVKLGEFLEKSDGEQIQVYKQNEDLRVALDEQQEFFENQDIESEHQITSLANQVDDLHSALDDQCRDLNTINKQLLEREQEVEGYLSKINSLESNVARQQSVIESLRDDLDGVKSDFKEASRERDELLLRNASLSHELEIEKRQSGNQLEEIQLQLKDVKRELEICRIKIRQQEEDIDSATRIEALEAKQAQLEGAINDRDTTIRLQQQRLNDMKKTLQKEIKSAGALSPNSEGSSSSLHRSNHILSSPNLSLVTEEEGAGLNFQYMKHVMLRFFTATDYEAPQLVRAVSTLLKLSSAEEQLIWDTLRWKQSWVPGSKPQLRSNLRNA